MTGKVRSKILVAKITQLRDRMAEIHSLSKTVSPDDKSLFLMRASDVDNLIRLYEEAVIELQEVKLDLDPNYTPTLADLNTFQQLADEVKVVVNSLQPQQININSRVSLNTTQSDQIISKVKLEPLKIIDFDGSPESWTPFYQQFLELIDGNHGFSDLQKVTYLTSHLKGSAKSIVAGIPPTEANYRLIFETLKNRFEDNRAMGHYYLDKLFNHKSIAQESEKGLNLFLEEFVGATAALRKLEIEDLFDFVLVHLSIKKLDLETVKQFDMMYREEAIPRFDQLVKFVRAQTKILARSRKNVSGSVKSGCTAKASQAFIVQQPNVASNSKLSKFEFTCPSCKTLTSHSLEKCPTFLKMEPKRRFALIKGSKRCYRCLGRHFSKSCSSRTTCGQCQGSHNELLHFFDAPVVNPPVRSGSPSQLTMDSPLTTATSSLVSCHTAVLLATAQVIAFDSGGQPVVLRALLDSGSQSHFLRRDCCLKLGLIPRAAHSVIRGLGKKSCPIRERVTVSLRSRLSPKVEFSVDALVMDELTDNLPSVRVDLTALSHIVCLDLADPHFDIPGPIDLLIGAELWPSICGTQKVVGPPDTPSALQSSLGWLVMGSAPVSSCYSSHLCYGAFEDPLDKLLEKFWLLEEVPSSPACTPNDDKCEQIFVETMQRDDKGRYIVALPFRMSSKLLGKSFRMAVQRFEALERRFAKNVELHRQYCEVISSYIAEGYLSLVPDDVLDPEAEAYYIPHHGVLKTDSASTPLRVVLNASAQTTSGLSLNDVLHVGPKLQSNLVGVLLNFRLFRFALSADIRQMYLRILVRPEDRKFQRIVWRQTPHENIRVYEMNVVAFGVAPSPYLALRCIQHLITSESHNFPLAAVSAYRDMYIDDYLSSVPSEDGAHSLQNQMASLFSSGSFTLAKWASNSKEVLSSISEDLRSPAHLQFEPHAALKVLGLQWDPQLDLFSVRVNIPRAECTKRNMMSAIARIFDPLGFLAPLTILAKGFVKTLWSLKLGWDESPPDAICHQWMEFVKELELLKTWCIPRHSFVAPEAQSFLVGFSDASQRAYGAVVYVVTHTLHQGVQVSLLLAKSKVAPEKTVSIPRLELCASLMLSSLLCFILDTYSNRFKFKELFALTDSTVALHWISAPPARWATFVANRVSKIQQNIPVSCWHHVRGESNPADCLSRGLSTKPLLEHQLWWKGPKWLNEPIACWPITRVHKLGTPASPIPEEKCISLNAADKEPWGLFPLLARVSSYRKLLRITAYVMRAFRSERPRCHILQASELFSAEMMWLRQVQLHYFPDFFEYLHGTHNKTRGRRDIDPLLRRLDLFLDTDIIRVGGRLKFSRIPYDQRHPILLPKSGRFVELLVDQYHVDNLHTGPHVLLSLLSLKYWLLSARTLVRQRVHKCTVCYRARPRPLNPKMAPLPALRFQQMKAFWHSGVDYAGPFTVSIVRRRGGSTLKAYVCLFICLSTKAVHLELASNLSTDCFLAAFRRFLSRRGPCQVMCSDQGTNFIGAKNKLDDMCQLTTSKQFNDSVEGELAWRGIHWKLNPPSAPHFGGIWERSVQSVKTHLFRVTHGHILTYEEFNTLLIQVEAVMNSRPLSVLTSDPNGPTALTPAHFLTLGPTLEQLPNEDLGSIPPTRLDHYQRVTYMVQSIWNRWQQEYLHTLQQREKWTHDAPPLLKGSVVVVMQENSPPLHWPLAVVQEICTSPDGVQRVAKVRTAKGELVRPLVKLCPLPEP